MSPDDAAKHSTEDQRQRRDWHDADVRRALEVAKQAGLDSYRVEIAPDGTIAIVVGSPADTAPLPDFRADMLDP